MFPDNSREETELSPLSVHVEPSPTFTVVFPVELIAPLNSVFFIVQLRELISSTMTFPSIFSLSVLSSQTPPLILRFPTDSGRMLLKRLRCQSSIGYFQD